MADQEIPMPVGYRFHPTDQEIVGYYLRHKLLADDPSINHIIPEIGVCKCEPWDLLDWATSAALATKFDEFQCFFFSPCDYKYSNSTRINRTTLRGFWKVTGRDRKIKQRGTNNVIGTKKTLVFHERCGNRGLKTNWVIHEYHALVLPPDQRSHVLCWLKKNNEKKIKEKPDEPSFLNRSSMVQKPPQPSGAIDSMIQTPPQPSGAIDSMIQTPPQLSGAIDSMIQIPPLPSGAIDSMIRTPPLPSGAIDSMIRTPPLPNGAIDSMIRTPPQLTVAIDSMIQTTLLNEVIDSVIHTPPQLNETISPFQSMEVIDSMIQPHLQPNESLNPILQTPLQSMVQTPFEPDEAMISIVHTRLSEPNSTVETLYDPSELEFNLFDIGELGFSLFDVGDCDFTSPLQLSPSMNEPVPFESLATSDMNWYEA